jgi:50S ribosomal protein L16 3-hydroxylase
MKHRLLGGLAPRMFLRRHWQKRPLFVRGALPGFRGVMNERALRALAARDDVESRTAVRRGRRYQFAHGPFKSLVNSARNFTLLVSGVNLHVAAADRLLRRFDFVPQARLDDVMVSFAVPGGGVGPHVDSYDVFLLQGSGRRRWRVWHPGGAAFDEYVTEAGDLLYLPPGWEHDGVALDRCFTYSIGFRAPRGAELAAAFLDWLNERGLPDARYCDPGLEPARRPALIPSALIDFSGSLLKRIRWGKGDVVDFLGRYLTEPKAHVVFRPSASRVPLRRALVALDLRTQLLYSGERFFINGERFAVPGRARAVLRALADQRSAQGARLAACGLSALLSEWRRAGYAHLQEIHAGAGSIEE